MRELDNVGTIELAVAEGEGAAELAVVELAVVELADRLVLVHADANANTDTRMARRVGRTWSIFPDGRDLEQVVRPKERFRHSRDVLAVEADLPDERGHVVGGER